MGSLVNGRALVQVVAREANTLEAIACQGCDNGLLSLGPRDGAKDWFREDEYELQQPANTNCIRRNTGRCSGLSLSGVVARLIPHCGILKGGVAAGATPAPRAWP